MLPTTGKNLLRELVMADPTDITIGECVKALEAGFKLAKAADPSPSDREIEYNKDRDNDVKLQSSKNDFSLENSKFQLRKASVYALMALLFLLIPSLVSLIYYATAHNLNWLQISIAGLVLTAAILRAIVAILTKL